MMITADPNDPRLEHGGQDEKPGPPNEVYLVLSEAERAKGFVRPVRRSYRHVGAPGPKYPLRDLTQVERDHYSTIGYVKFEEYPESEDPIAGRFWTQEQLDLLNNGCGQVTTMHMTIAETYARDPHFYGQTYCATCGVHKPVEEFVWVDDGSRVGS